MTAEGEPGKQQHETELLALAVQTGDRDTFHRLYSRVAPAVLAWAELRIPAHLRSLVSPDDLVQEVWFRAHAKISDYDSKRSFRAWIFGFANRVLFEAFRQKSTGGADDLHFSAVPAEVTTVVRKAARNEGTTALLSVFGELDPDDKKLLALRGIEGLAFEKVAEEFGVTSAVVRKRWERLRKRLADEKPPEGLLVD